MYTPANSSRWQKFLRRPGSNLMTIQVELIDGTFCRVVPKGLDLLLRRELVKRFLRSSGWAVVGRDPIRYPGTQVKYNGPERRFAA